MGEYRVYDLYIALNSPTLAQAILLGRHNFDNDMDPEDIDFAGGKGGDWGSASVLVSFCLAVCSGFCESCGGGEGVRKTGTSGGMLPAAKMN